MAESMVDDPLDVCECGDYRHQHETQGNGRCRVCYGSPAPYDNCGRFRLFRRAETKEESHG